MFENLIVLIPAFNEEDSISSVVERVKKYATPLVVDDGSIDRTGDLARLAGAVVLKHTENQGYEKALETGFDYFKTSGFFFVITLDADNQHDPDLIGVFHRHLTGGSDCVVGIRDRLQRFSEHVFAIVARSIWNIQDPLCGMKAYSKKCFNLPIEADFDSIGTKYAINSVRNGLIVSQVNIITKSRAGDPRFGTGMKANVRILAALLRLFLRFK